jgi:hypothetical protein
VSEAINCPFCGGSGAGDESSLPCVACNGHGTVVDTGPAVDPDTLATERFTVSGKATARVLVKWPDGTTHTLFRPPTSDPGGP